MKIVIVVLVIMAIVAVVGDVYFGLQTKNLNADNTALSANVTLANATALDWEGKYNDEHQTALDWEGKYNNEHQTALDWEGKYNDEHQTALDWEGKYNTANESAESLKGQLDKYKAKELKNPTYAKAKEILAELQTNLSKNVYAEVGTAQILIAIRGMGVKAYWAVVEIERGGYWSFIMFDTTDKGPVYFRWMNLDEGEIVPGGKVYGTTIVAVYLLD